jgi:hypothetical protein
MLPRTPQNLTLIDIWSFTLSANLGGGELPEIQRRNQSRGILPNASNTVCPRDKRAQVQFSFNSPATRSMVIISLPGVRRPTLGGQRYSSELPALAD